MARKNLLTGLTERKTGAEAGENETPARSPSPAFSGRGAFGAVTRTIDDLAARADAARALEAQLTAGAVIIELEPRMVDRSFMPDRMEAKDESYEALKASIAASGQDSPILVRPHPEAKGRYQVAFGHRRLRAAASAGSTPHAGPHTPPLGLPLRPHGGDGECDRREFRARHRSPRGRAFR